MYTVQRTKLALAALCLTVGAASPALAGGYDTPILYSARHIGMGGTAIGHVDDPSAVFHNPAGLANMPKRFSILGDFSLLLGNISAPVAENNISHESDTTVGTFFLVGAGMKVTDWFSFGVAFYPVASAGATYEYSNSTSTTVLHDFTRLVFLEVAPSIAFEYRVGDVGIRLGGAWRITLAELQREKGPLSNPTQVFDMDLAGTNLAGFKLGLQIDLFDTVDIGFVYRHEVVTELSADTATVLVPLQNVKTEFTLPSKIGMGIRVRPNWRFSGAFDVEYGFNSQNSRSSIAGSFNGTAAPPVNQFFEWDDAITIRTGLEYKPIQMLALRAGYLYDAKTSNKKWPTAFGTPPGPTQSITAGVGFSFLDDMLDVNLAYAYRFGDASVTVADKGSGCASCSFAGDYDIQLHGIYLDISGNFDF